MLKEVRREIKIKMRPMQKQRIPNVKSELRKKNKTVLYLVIYDLFQATDKEGIGEGEWWAKIQKAWLGGWKTWDGGCGCSVQNEIYWINSKSER